MPSKFLSTFRPLALALGLVCSAGVAAFADNIRGTPYYGPNYYASRSLDPIQVTLRRNQIGAEETVSLIIPRAYIVFASGYTQREYDELPTAINSRQAKAAITYEQPIWSDEGRPYTVVFDELFEANRREKKVAVALIRPRSAFVGMFYSGSSFDGLARSPLAESHGFPAPSIDGLKAIKLGSNSPGVIYFSPDNEDEFVEARCSEKAKKGDFCQYVFLLCRRLLRVNADFLDFRFHGGRTYANEQVRALKRTIRPWIQSCPSE